MAIFAEVKHRRVNATVSYRQLVSSASLEKASIHVHTTKSFALTNYQELTAFINYQHLYANTNWQRLLLANVKVNAERTIYTFADNYSFTDQATLQVQPNYSDSFGVSDSINSFAVAKGLSDNQEFSDTAILNIGKAPTDDFTFSDAINNFGVGKGLSDSQSFQDTQAFAVEASLSDSFSWQDDAVVSVSTSTSDTFSLTDTPVFTQTKVKTSSTTMQDSVIRGVDRDVTDSLTFEDSIGAVRNPYSFTFVFGDDSISVSGYPDDDFSLTDTLAFNTSIAVSDAFGLDDFAQVDKSTTGVKTNLISVTDEAVSNFGKVVENHTFSFTEDQEFALSKPLSDSIIGVLDSPAFSASRQVSDSYEITDAVTLSPWIGSSDNFNVTDELELDLTIHGSLLNKGLIGNVLLNAQ